MFSRHHTPRLWLSSVLLLVVSLTLGSYDTGGSSATASPLDEPPTPVAMSPLPTPPAVGASMDSNRAPEWIKTRTYINDVQERNGLTLISILYDFYILNYKRVIVSDETEIVDAAGQPTTLVELLGSEPFIGGWPNLFEQIDLEAYYFREPYDIQPYTVYAKRIAAVPPPEPVTPEPGRGLGGYLSQPPSYVLQVDPATGMVYVSISVYNYFLKGVIYYDENTKFFFHDPAGVNHVPATVDDLVQGVYIVGDGGQGEELRTPQGDLVYLQTRPDIIYLFPAGCLCN